MDRHDLIGAPRRLETSRLVLEAPTVSHAAPMRALVNANLPNLGFIAWAQQAWTPERAVRFCEGGMSMVQEGECLVFNVFRRDDQALVGRIDLHSFDFDAPRAEIGYVGDARQSGLGLMREAVLAVVQLGFTLGLARIEAITEVENVRALRFAQAALGFAWEGRMHHRERDARGQLCDQMLFAAFPPVGQALPDGSR